MDFIAVSLIKEIFLKTYKMILVIACLKPSHSIFYLDKNRHKVDYHIWFEISIITNINVLIKKWFKWEQVEVGESK